MAKVFGEYNKLCTPSQNGRLKPASGWSCYKTPNTPLFFSSSDSDENEENKNAPSEMVKVSNDIPSNKDCSKNQEQKKGASKISTNSSKDVALLATCLDKSLDISTHQIETPGGTKLKNTLRKRYRTVTKKCEIKYRRIFIADSDESSCETQSLSGSNPSSPDISTDEDKSSKVPELKKTVTEGSRKGYRPITANESSHYETQNSVASNPTIQNIGSKIYIFKSDYISSLPKVLETPQKFKPNILQCDGKEYHSKLPEVPEKPQKLKPIVAQSDEEEFLELAKVPEMPQKFKPTILQCNEEESLPKLPEVPETPQKLKPIVLQSDEESPELAKIPETPQKFKPIVLQSDEEESPPASSRNILLSDTPSIFPPSSTINKKLSFLKSLSPSVPESAANPEALEYRKRYKKLKHSLAQKLYSLYNEKVFDNRLPSDMILDWNGYLASTAGYFQCSKNSMKISLSSKILDCAHRLRDTLLHEMCHAAVLIIDRKKDGHGLFWQNYALKCKITFPEVPLPKRCHNYSLEYRYTFACDGCGVTFGKFRLAKSFDISRYTCKRCKGKFRLVGKR